MKISKHFTLDEFLQSQTAKRHGIDMTPSSEIVANLSALAVNVLDPLRVHAKCPIIISSGFRPPELNRRVGGSSTSQHMDGEASDNKATKVTPYNLCQMAIRLKLPFDQLIYEYGAWMHASYKRNGPQRGQVLTYKMVAGKTMKYTGLVK